MGEFMKKIEIRDRGYFEYGSYLSFVIGRIRNGGVWSAVKNAYKHIRKYTLITAVLRTLVTVVALLEKSALLLLVLTVALFLLPLAIIPMVFIIIGSIIGYFRMHRIVGEWLFGAERVTVYLTSEDFLGKGGMNFKVTNENAFDTAPLFARCAMVEAGEYTHPVIVVCGGRFLTAKWEGFNLLKVKCHYFFILKKYYFAEKNVSYVVID